MALIQNGRGSIAASAGYANPMRFVGGVKRAFERQNFGSDGLRLMQFTYGTSTAPILRYSGVPYGLYPPGPWTMPLTGGAMLATYTTNGAGNVSAAAGAAIGIAASLTGNGDILSANASLIVQATASLLGTSSLSGTLLGILQAAAGLTGTGGASGTPSGLGQLVVSLTAAGTLSGTPTGPANMSASITATGTALTTENAGAVIWGQTIEGGYKAQEILKLIAAMAAGKLAGAPTGPITITGIDGSTTRITATVDSNGNRLTVTYNVS